MKADEPMPQTLPAAQALAQVAQVAQVALAVSRSGWAGWRHGKRPAPLP